MADDLLLGKVHGVSDLELAVLLSLICREHCIISTEPDALDRLVHELQLITTNTFALKPVVVDCRPQTTLQDFATGIQLASSLASPAATAPRPASPFLRQSHLHSTHNPQASFGHASYHTAHSGGGGGGRLAPLTPVSPSVAAATAAATAAASAGGGGELANVVLAKNLNLAPKAVQIQALELLRTKRLFTRSSMLVAPKQFLFVAVLSSSSSSPHGPLAGELSSSSSSSSPVRLTSHLNDFFYLAHWHDPDDGFVNLESEWGARGKDISALHGHGSSSSSNDDDNETASLESVVRTKRGSRSEMGGMRESGRDGGEPLFTEQDISTLANMSQGVSVDIDVTRYQMNIVSFLRLHRAVAGGISPTGTKHFGQLMRCLAPLHGSDFITPALVALAAKKVYLHRIQVVAPDQERSMQWGSDIRAIKEILQEIRPEEIIDDVLHMVATPL